MRALKEALVNKGNIKKAVKDREYFIYMTTSYNPVIKDIYTELREYQIKNFALYMWLLSKSQLNEIHKKYKTVREDKLAKLYIVPSGIDLKEIKNASINWDISDFIKKFGLILTPNKAQ